MSKETTRNLVSPRDLLEKALASERGVRIWFGSQSEAVSMRNRMATVKTEERKKSTKIYDLDSPLYNTSAYDSLAVIIKPGILSVGEEVKKLFSLSPEEALSGVWLYILPQGESEQGFIVEEL